MDVTFKALLAVRKKVVSEIKGLSLDQLNKIPKGFNNNILWNIGHVLVVHQLLAYRLSGLPILLDESFVQLFGKGSKPQEKYNEDMLEKLTRLLTCTVQDLEQDYKSGIFNSFKTYRVETFNVELHSIEEAIQFITIHDATHFGYLLALKKAVLTKKRLF